MAKGCPITTVFYEKARQDNAPEASPSASADIGRFTYRAGRRRCHEVRVCERAWRLKEVGSAMRPGPTCSLFAALLDGVFNVVGARAVGPDGALIASGEW